jgi:mono/diheme cytochrome c family protein
MRIGGPITGDLEGDIAIVVLIAGLFLLIRVLDPKSPGTQRLGAFAVGIGVLSLSIALYVDAQRYALPYLNTPLDYERAAMGQTLYNQQCMDCHGMNGRGMIDMYGRIPPDLTTHIFQHDDAYLVFAIANGRGRMPPFRTMLLQSQINDVIQYVRLLGKKELGAR